MDVRVASEYLYYLGFWEPEPDLLVTPWGFAAIGGGELDTTSPRIGFLENSRILHMTKPTWDAPWSKPVWGEKISLPVARPTRLRVVEARGTYDTVRPTRGGGNLLAQPGLLQQTCDPARGRRRVAVD